MTPTIVWLVISAIGMIFSGASLGEAIRDRTYAVRIGRGERLAKIAVRSELIRFAKFVIMVTIGLVSVSGILSVYTRLVVVGGLILIATFMTVNCLLDWRDRRVLVKRLRNRSLRDDADDTL